MVLALLLSLFLVPAHAQDQGGYQSACFQGLNDADSPATLNSCDAQDTLNVESNLQGTAAIKRKGFSKVADLSCATCPVTGSHSFIDSSGNRLDIVCYNKYCAKSTNGNAFADFLTQAASSATRWSFVDVGGSLYGGNNAYEPIIKYDGTTLSRPAGMPKGSILELTQDRLAIGDISGSPNRVHLSSAGEYTGYTVGVNPEDSYFDDYGAPGDRVRGLKHLNGVLYVFKTASITGCELGDQYSTRCAVISPNLGTTDPGSIVTAGSCLYFRAQDKNYWELCGTGLRQISQKIPNLVKSQSGGTAGGEQTNTQTSQGDWEAGTQKPSATWDTSTVPGAILSTGPVTNVDTSTESFALGTLSNATTGTVSSDPSVLGGLLFANTGFEKGGSGGWTIHSGWATPGVIAGFSNCLGTYAIGSANCAASRQYNGSVKVVKDSDDTLLYVNTISGGSGGTGCSAYYFDISTQTVSMRLVVVDNINVSSFTTIAFSSHSLPAGILNYSFGAQNGGASCAGGNLATSLAFDMVDPFYVPTSTFTSQAFDTGYSTPTWGVFRATATLGTSATAYYTSQASANGSAWDTPVPFVTDGRGASAGKRYLRYNVNFKSSLSTQSASVQAMGVSYASTGTFRTQCIQPNSSISAWGTLSCAQALTGAGASIVYYATSAASCATLPSTLPNEWQTSVTNNATLPITINTAVVIGWRSLIGSATDQARVDACALSWNEGTATQPSWAVYDSIKNAIYWTSTINGAASTNRLLKFDRNLEAWYPFDIPAQAPKIINNYLYFGGASSGTWNQYGLVDSDAGSAINGYWKSKDVGSDKPFQEKNFDKLSVLARNNGTGSLTATYTFSNAETGAYSMSLSTGSGILYARFNENLPMTSPQQFMNLKVGNNSTTPFEVLGIGISWHVLPWNVHGP